MHITNHKPNAIRLLIGINIILLVLQFYDISGINKPALTSLGDSHTTIRNILNLPKIIGNDEIDAVSNNGINKLRQLIAVSSSSSSTSTSSETLLDTTSDHDDLDISDDINDKPRVAVFSMFIQEKKKIIRLNSDVLVPINDYIIENHKKYCQLHNYTYILFEENVVPGLPWSTYQKPYMFEKIFSDKKYLSNKFNINNTFDYALFLDFDAIFINNTQNILNLFSNIVPNKYNKHFGNKSYFLNTNETNSNLSIIIAGDIGGIVNAGVIAMKNTKFTSQFLSEWKLAPIGLKWEDQGQLSAILSGANSGMKFNYWESVLSTNFYYETMYWSQVFYSYQNRVWDGYKPYVAIIAPIELNIQESYLNNITNSRTNDTIKKLHYMHDIECNNNNKYNNNNDNINRKYLTQNCYYKNSFILHAYWSDKIVVLAKYLNISNIGNITDLENRDIILDSDTQDDTEEDEDTHENKDE